MHILVVVKAVPALDRIEFDPVRRAVVRESAELFLNPFDQRALRVGLELRSPGDRATVASMGPPAAAEPLRDALAVGADRAILVTDPSLAGSDTLATARALAAVARQVTPDLVLAGAWSTDSETGQVGPELAALLDVPIASEARSVAWGLERTVVDVVGDTADGWAGWRLPLPAVVTVGEKIVKPLRPDPERRAAIAAEAIERWSLADLRLGPADVGDVGSPTRVVAVADAGFVRSPRVFAEGPVQRRVEEALAALRPRLLNRPPPPPLGPAPTSRAPDREVVVLVTDAEGALAGSIIGAVAEVRRSLPDHWASVLWVGAAPTEADGFRLYGAGALAGYVQEDAALPVDSERVAASVRSLLRTRPHLAGAIFPSDPFGREVAGIVAARASLGLTGDAVGVSVSGDGDLQWTKPSFGGRTLATVQSRTRPSLATVRAGAFAVPRGPVDSGGFGWHALPPNATVGRRVPTGRGREVDGGPELDAYEVVVAVGMGVGGPDGMARIAPAIRRWGAGLGATRRVVDAGWVPRQRQVGLTGRLLAPRLAILLGVSGSVNHVVGWRRAGAVLAVNRDPAAPVFQDVDVGIVGEIDAVLPALVEPLAAALGR